MLTPANSQAALELEPHLLSVAQAWCFWVLLARVNADLAAEDDMATAQAVSESDAASSPGVAAAIAQVSNSTNWNKSQDS